MIQSAHIFAHVTRALRATYIVLQHSDFQNVPQDSMWSKPFTFLNKKCWIYYNQTFNISCTKSQNLMFLFFSDSCLCPIHCSLVLSGEWRCSWSSADRRCSNYICVINNFIAYKDATYIRDLTVCCKHANLLKIKELMHVCSDQKGKLIILQRMPLEKCIIIQQVEKENNNSFIFALADRNEYAWKLKLKYWWLHDLAIRFGDYA